MTRKDYELIAGIIRQRVEIWRGATPHEDAAHRMAELRTLASDFARELIVTNGRFDAARFMEACGL